MALAVNVVEGERCDKCKNGDGAMLQLYQSGRGRDERNIIFVHERCLQKSVDAAKKRAAELSKATS